MTKHRPPLWPYWLKVLIKPSSWMQLAPFSCAWDKALIHVIRNHRFTMIRDGRVAKVGTYQIWVANHPYGSFTPRDTGLPEDVRPRRSTILWAYECMMQDAFAPSEADAEISQLERMYRR